MSLYSRRTSLNLLLASFSMPAKVMAIGLTVNLDTYPGTPEAAVSDALDQLCPQLLAMSARDAAQEKLAAVCTALNDAAVNPDERWNTLKSLSARAASSETVAANYLPTGKTVSAVGENLGALRTAQQRLSWWAPGDTPRIPLLFAAGDHVVSDAGETAEARGLSAYLSLDSGNFTQDNTTWVSGMEGTSSGLALGADYSVNSRLFAGAAFSYASHDANLNDGGSLTSTSNGLTLYTNYAVSDTLDLGATLAWGQQAYDMRRKIQFVLGSTVTDDTAGSKPQGSNLGLNLSGGWQTRLVGGTGLAVNGNLYYANQTIDRFRESGSEGFALVVDQQSIKTLRMDVGAVVHHAFSTSLGVMTPQLSLTWLHEFTTDGQDITAHFVADPGATPFRYNTQQRDPDFAQLALGLPLTFANGFSAFLQYESLLALDNFTQNTLTLGARMEF